MRSLTAAVALLAVLVAAPLARAEVTVVDDGENLTVLAAERASDVYIWGSGNGSQTFVDSRDSQGIRCPGEPEPTPRCVRGGRGTVTVRFGDEDDVLTTASTRRTVVTGNAGDDVFRPSPGSGRYDGGPGSDELDFYGTGPGVDLRHESRPSSSAILFRGIESVVGTPDDDILVSGPDVRIMRGGNGADHIDVRDGERNVAECGLGEDIATVDDLGEAGPDCEHIRFTALASQPDAPPGAAAIPIPPRPPPPPPQRRYRALLAAPPALSGSALTFALHPLSGFTTTIGLRAWRDAPPLATVAGPAAGGPVSLPLPPASRAQLARDGRLRVHVRVASSAGGAETDAILVARRTSRVTGDGRRLRGSFGVQRLRGTAKGDHLNAMSADDLLLGRSGNDALLGGTGNDRLLGGAGHDHLEGNDGDDVLRGGEGDDDLVEARFGEDRLDGGPGDDVLAGGRAGDVLSGGPGDDVLRGGSGADRFDCGPGEDVAFVNFAAEEGRIARDCEHVYDEDGVIVVPCAESGTPSPETVLGTAGDDACLGDGGNDDVEGRGGDDALDGGAGNDRVFGRFGVDRLAGGDGNDELEGGRGRDVLDGGPGTDQLNGGFDPDVLAAGAGADVVIARGGGRDLIDCGPGTDRATVDSADVVVGCERVDRSGGRRRR